MDWYTFYATDRPYSLWLLEVPDVVRKSLEDVQLYGTILATERRKKPRTKPNAWVQCRDAAYVEILFYLMTKVTNIFEHRCRYHHPFYNHNFWLSKQAFFVSAMHMMVQERREHRDRAVLITLAGRDAASHFAQLPHEIICILCTYIVRRAPRSLDVNE